MRAEGKPAFVAAILQLAEVFNEPMSPGRLEGYFEALRDLPLADVLAAIEESQATCEDYFPKPGKIRAIARPPKEYVLNCGAYGGLLHDASSPQRQSPALQIEERRADPAEIEAVATAVRQHVEAVADAHREQRARASVMTEDEVNARKAVLRAQLALVKE